MIAAVASTASLVSIVLMLAVGAAGIGVGVLFSRRITRQVDAAVGVAQAIAGGDLTTSVRVQGQDEIAQLLRALQSMQGSLARVVGNVRSNSESGSISSA